jgi:hypothetical protein
MDHRMWWGGGGRELDVIWDWGGGRERGEGEGGGLDVGKEWGGGGRGSPLIGAVLLACQPVM